MQYSKDDNRPVLSGSHAEVFPEHIPISAGSLLDSFVSNICIIDDKGTIIQTNEAWDRFARDNGASPEFVGRGINYLEVVGHSNPEVYTILTNILSGKSRSHTYEYECHSPTEKRWFVLTVSPLSEENFTGAILQHFNITQRRKTELELEKSENKYRFFFENIHFAVIKTDEDFRILRWNKAAEEIFGYTPNEMIGAEMFKLYYSDADNPAHTRDRIVSTLQKGEINFSENYNRKKDGTKIICSWKDVPYITPEGKILYFSIAEDISFRKKMEKRLKVSERQYRTLFETMAQGVVYQNAAGEIININPAAKEMIGKSREELRGLTSESPEFITVREDFSPFPGKEHPAMKALQTGLEIRNVVMGIYRKDEDRYRWINVHATPLFEGNDPAPTHVYTTFEDITLLKETEKELKESELKYKTFARFFPDIILIFDQDLRYHLVDGKGLANLKLRREEIMGKTIYEILPEETYKIMEPNYHGALRGEKRSFRVAFQSRNFLVRVVPLADAGGKISRGMAIAQDITHRREMERTLAVAEEKYKTLINTTGTGYFISDLEGEILDANDEYLEQIGSSSIDEVIGTNVLQYVADHDKELFSKEINICKNKSSIKNLQIDFVNNEKKVKNIIMNASVIREHGSYRIMAVTTDISTYKLLEARLKMESLGTLVLGIGHDFNNILAKITGHASLIMENTSMESGALRSMELITAAADKGAALVDKLYEFGMPKKISTVSVDLYTCVKDVFDLFEMTSNRLIEKRIDFKKGEFFVQGEYHDLFFNLTKNSIDAIEERGAQSGDCIVVRAADYLPMEADNIEAARSYVLVEFEDSGPGIPNTHIDRIFEPGFSTKPLGTDSGRGFGLAMAYKDVDGRIRVTSSPAAGTKFELFLIKAESARTEEMKPKIPLDVRGTETILVVDDEEAILEFSKEALERKGYDVITAVNGSDAVSILELNYSLIDLVIFDLTMPKMSGGEAFLKMKSLKENGKFIVSSGHHENYLHAKNLQGVDAFLQKPYKAEQLLKTVREVLND